MRPQDLDTARTVLRRTLDTLDLGALDNVLVRGETLEAGQTSRFEVSGGLADRIAEDVQGRAGSVAERELLAYDPSYQTHSSQALVEPLADIPELERIDRSVRGGDLRDEEGGGRLLGMVHAVGHGQHRIIAYRLSGQGLVARPKRGLFVLVPRGNTYEEMDGRVLYYEPRFDVYTCGGFAYFTAVSVIQRRLHADGKARELARTTLRRATARIRIQGAGDLEEAVVEDPNLRAKMAQVARALDASPELEQLLQTRRLVDFALQNPSFEIEVTSEHGEPALVFNPSPQGRFRIPKLLADDFLHSDLTGRYYDAGSKAVAEPHSE